jgi:excisionase family DNA binding protein
MKFVTRESPLCAGDSRLGPRCAATFGSFAHPRRGGLAGVDDIDVTRSMSAPARSGEIVQPYMLTVAEAAELLAIGKTMAYELVRLFVESGGAYGIPAMKIGRIWRVPQPELMERIRTGRIDARGEWARDELAPRRFPDVDGTRDSGGALGTSALSEGGRPVRPAGASRPRREPPPDQPSPFPAV